MSDPLPIASAPAKHNKLRLWAVHSLRLSMLVLLVAALGYAGSSQRERPASGEVKPLELDAVMNLLPDAAALRESPDGSDQWQEAIDMDDDAIARCLQTSPQGDSVVGYRGCSNCVVVMDTDGVVQSVALLDSEDTPEHVAAVEEDHEFFNQFRGWRFGESNPSWQVDGASGATLTSLAIAEAVALRLAPGILQDRPRSLKFPEAVSSQQVVQLFGEGARLADDPNSPELLKVLDQNNQPLGWILRTAMLVDTLMGYQGPSDVLVALDDDGNIEKLMLGKTYDNLPYVDYVREEAYFWNLFVGKSVDDLSALDLEEAGIEGVSGATMTSMTVAETLVAAATAHRENLERARRALIAEKEKNRIRLAAHDWGSLIVLAIAILIAMTRLKGHRWIKLGWNIVLVVYFGLVTGNLISMAVIMGWSSIGIPWRLAPGLAAVLVTGAMFPALSKHNVYCSHICPHGAAQQILRPRFAKAWKLGPRVSGVLRWIAPILLIGCYLATLLALDWNLSCAEPFNAYIWYVSGGISIALAVFTLAVSRLIPMAYCRLGCPTGYLLGYMRLNARSGHIRRADLVVLLLVVGSWAYIAYQ